MPDQGVIDALTALGNRQIADNELLLRLLGRHLREHHGMSRRKVAQWLGVRERWVRDHIDALYEEDTDG